jgi:hypothetical protein
VNIVDTDSPVVIELGMNVMTPDVSPSVFCCEVIMVLHVGTPCSLVQVHHTAGGKGCVPRLLVTRFTEFHVPAFIGPDMATSPPWTYCTPNDFSVPYADRQRMKN